MQKALLVGLLISWMGYWSVPADDVKSYLNFTGVSPKEVLEMYRQLSERQLIEASNVSLAYHRGTINLQLAGVTKTEAMAAMEKALRDQAAIIITPIDNQRTSITFNDALPLTALKSDPRPSQRP